MTNCGAPAEEVRPKGMDGELTITPPMVPGMGHGSVGAKRSDQGQQGQELGRVHRHIAWHGAGKRAMDAVGVVIVSEGTAAEGTPRPHRLLAQFWRSLAVPPELGI